MAAKKLTGKQEKFILEYLKDLNGTQAAMRAGYSQRGADVAAVRLLANASIRDEIARAKAKRSEETKVDANYVLTRLAQIDQMDVSDIITDEHTLKPISQWPTVWRRSITGIDVAEIISATNDAEKTASFIKKIKWPDKLRNLELMGRHVDVNAFAESKQEGEGDKLADALTRVLEQLPN